MHLYDAQVQRLQELRADAEHLLKKASCSANERLYISLIEVFIDAALQHLKNLQEKIELIKSEDLTPGVREIQLDKAKELVSIATTRLREVHRSHTTTIPIGTDGLIRDVFVKSTEVKISFFLNISSSQEYSIMPTRYEELKSYIVSSLNAKVPKDLDKIILIINLFANQKSDILRHAVFAHEAGHALVRLDKKFGEGYLKLIQLFYMRLKEEINAVTKTSSLNLTQLNEVTDYFTRVYKSWIEELFADLVSIYSMGPAAYFSMVELAEEELSFSTSASTTHPPIYKRLYMLYRYLETLGFLSILSEPLQATLLEYHQYYRKFDELDKLLVFRHGQPINNILTAQHIDDIVTSFVANKFSGKYTCEEFKEEALPLCEYLKKGIAACELIDVDKHKFRAVTGQSLLNAGWLIAQEKTLKNDQLNPILNKALTNIYLKQKWSSLSGAEVGT